MKNIKLISIFLVILSSVLTGCVQAPPGTPTPVPTATPTVTATAEPTAVPTTPTPAPTPVRVPFAYKSYVESNYGFKDVRVIGNKSFFYQNFTLNISTGDKVIWVNDDSDYALTVVSEQGLWDNITAKLRWRTKEFNYTFIQPGIYGIYIKEFPRKRQKIIVNQ